jgi:thioredoxin reductase (NADPH)
MINTDRIDNYLGFEEISGADLSLKMFNQITFNQIKYKSFDVKLIEKKNKKFIIEGNNDNIECDKVIIASGKRKRKLNLPNENIKGISYCAVCDGMFYKDKVVAVVGGGDSALTEALHLSKLCEKVYIIVRNKIRASKILLNSVSEENNIEIILGDEVLKINGTGKINSITLKSGQELKVEGLFISIGGISNIEFLDDLNIEFKNGNIITDDKMRTSEENIYAIGDIRNKDYYQISTAINDGIVAALDITEKRK